MQIMAVKEILGVKVADVKLSWSKSPSADVSKVQVVLVNDGVTTKTDFGPEVESYQIVVQARKSVQYSVITIDSEGLQATSVLYTFTLGDLENPLPATNLTHEVVGIRDVPDGGPPPA